MGVIPDSRAGRARHRRAMSTITASSALAADLRSCGFTGHLVGPGDARYDASRACFNAAVDARPTAVAHARDAEDVAAAIRAARRAGLPFTIRGRRPLRLRPLHPGRRPVHRPARPQRRRRRRRASRSSASAAARCSAELDAATQQHGLAVPAGQISHTGVGGLTLGGGLGWLMRAPRPDDRLPAGSGGRARRRVASSMRRRTSTPICSGRCAAAAATSASSRASSSALTASGRWCSPACSSTRTTGPARRCDARASSCTTRPRSSACSPCCRPHLRCSRFRRSCTAGPSPSSAWPGAAASTEGKRVLAPLRAERPPALDLIGPMPYVALQSMLDPTATPRLELRRPAALLRRALRRAARHARGRLRARAGTAGARHHGLAGRRGRTRAPGRDGVRAPRPRA